VRRAAPPLPSDLRASRRSLEGMGEVELLEDWQWDRDQGRWSLKLRLSPELTPNDYVPASTDWLVLVDEIYPEGDIGFYPAAEHGLTATFEHQSCNIRSSREAGKPSGKLCLDVPLRVLGRRMFEGEPSSAAHRLRWHVERAIEWLILASRGELAPAGEPFELPEFPPSRADRVLVAYAEGPDSLDRWDGHLAKVGIAKLILYRRNPDVYVVSRYLGDRGRALVTNVWGAEVASRRHSTTDAIWVTLPEVPVLPPWQAPVNWGDLREALRRQGVELDQFLEELFLLGALEKHRLMLLGFPIPREWEGKNERYHWQAISLPALHPVAKPVPGFRPDKRRAWVHNRTQVLKDDATIAWLVSQNWAADELGSRGMLGEEITSKRICLLGAGALGSVVVELLVRAGCRRLTVFDHDRLNAGNLVRHALTLEYVRDYKAEALSAHSNKASPHARVDYVNSSFPPSDTKGGARLEEADVVIDCTGSDATLHEMERYAWNNAKCFCSVSIGARARRLFVFGARSATFPAAEFRSRLDPWLRREAEEIEAGPEFPREGVGCWHPVFPARADDMWLLAAAAVKALVPFLERDDPSIYFKVYEQVEDDDGTFAGVAVR
jgi:hypothetical protein